MKILWIVNMVLPELAEHLGISTGSSGTWMIDIGKRLSEGENFELAVACVYGNKFQEIKINNTTYFILPGNGKNMLFYTKKYEQLWQKVYERFEPDIVHLHGTEYTHGLSFLRIYPNVKSIISTQGMLNRIKDVYTEGLTRFELFKYRTFKENIRLNGMLELSYVYKKNAKYEIEILNRVSYANCVNFWDQSLIKSINPKLNCFKIEYNLRDEFYSAPKWNIENIERHTIFTNPGGTPLKGLHMLLKSLAIVKKEYPKVRLQVPGFTCKGGKLIINNGYSKYISELIRKLDLNDNIIFLGRQTGEQMMENMRKANLVVVPSAIEGTSLVLREAMFLGTPCIASFRGGMADFISDKVDGYLYDYQEYPYLAYRIIELFEDDNLCNQFSKNAIEKAEKAHDREKNPQDYLDMYKLIYEDNFKN